jgi:hypothetical protein
VTEARFDEQVAPGRIVVAAVAFGVEREQPMDLGVGDGRAGVDAAARQLDVGGGDRPAGDVLGDASARKLLQARGRALGAFTDLQQSRQLARARRFVGEARPEPGDRGIVDMAGIGA